MGEADQTETLSSDTRDVGHLVLVVTGPQGVVEVPLAGKRVVWLGRSASCDVHIDDASVSRKHVMLVTDPLTITDLGSRNGTTLAGVKLAPEVAAPVTVGAAFAMGNITAVLRSDAAAAAKRESAALAATVVLDDPATREAYNQLDVIAPSNLAVLVLGETGAGKEVFAQALHQRSGRKGLMLELNCAALPESILEGELFGYERGAFTGAQQAREGLFEAANGGTVFLDEVGDLPLGTQAKLLRVLESGEILRLGSRKPTRIDVRFVSATHRDLDAMVRAGTFRSDLFYRVCAMTVTLPPLRARTDVLAIAEAFMRRAKGKGFSPEARGKLRAHDWPGNVRELRNVVERAVVLARGQIVEPTHLGVLIRATPAATAATNGALDAGVKGFERQKILEALEKAGGNKTRAAKLLGITRYALLYRIRELDIDS